MHIFQWIFKSSFFSFFFFCYLWTSGLVLQTRLLFRLKITHQVFHTEKLFSRYEVSGRMLSYVIPKISADFHSCLYCFVWFCSFCTRNPKSRIIFHRKPENVSDQSFFLGMLKTYMIFFCLNHLNDIVILMLSILPVL